MRSALICVFFAFIVHKEVSLAEEDFRPTPIPLNDWKSGSRESGEDGTQGSEAGTLQELIATDTPPAAAAVPAHYWEDALRHSVYLTLVRDKIDQLIAKGSVINPDGKTEQRDPTEVDDHDLWEKIKSAPFDRLKTEEPTILGDIAIMSKGRLLQEKDGLRFTEDEMSKEKCTEEKCVDDVKAYWSVKRVRQRDAEIAPGKYHYELTFAVSSQTPKKQKKPYENPVRTFTVREGTPVERPQYRVREPVPAPRPQRAVWVHKNIVPTPPHQKKQDNSLDRLFSSWFSSEEEPPVKRYKQVSYVPQRSKVGNAGSSSEHHHQKQQLLPYPYKPQTSYKYSRPPLGPPPVSHPHSQHHYIDLDTIRNQNQFSPPQTEYNYLPSNVIKTTKPGVLPTPPISYVPQNVTMELSPNLNVNDTTTKDPEIITGFTMHSKPKAAPTKVSYFPEHVRPPVFNAPPGVFVTMDKKPFKPMPPLKYNMHSFKHNKHKPVDFRPSPQVLDVQFSDPDPMSDAFRPITMGYSGGNTTESNMPPNGDRPKPLRKSKPPKKHENVKSHRSTTNAPDIITAHSEVLDEMHWASYLSAFAKTTPMMSYKLNFSEFTTPLPSTTVASTITVVPTPSTTEAQKITTTETPSKPKRTRPPPKFTKPMKAKKHKRLTSTSTTTTTTTTTEKPHYRRPSQDLTPLASSAATKTGWQHHNKTQDATLPTTPPTNATDVTVTSVAPEPTTTKMVPTTYRTVTTTREKTTTEVPSSTTETLASFTILQLNNKNRFRQSTLMHKGTSVNHDKWSSPYTIERNRTAVEKTRPIPTFAKYPRRKGSNFQGYSIPKIIDKEMNREEHIDQIFKQNLNVISLSSSTESATKASPTTTPRPTQATYEESSEQHEQDDSEEPNGTEDPDESEDSEDMEEDEDNDDQQTKDNEEFIFETFSSNSQDAKQVNNSNEVEAVIVATTEATVVTSTHSLPKNKTKCKKKKNATTTDQTPMASETENEISVAPLESTTEKLTSKDFFDQIFGLTVDQNETGGKNAESKFVDNDEDLEEFLASINRKKDNHESSESEYEEEDQEENEHSPFNNDEDNRFARQADSYEEYPDRPYSLLELMAME